MTPARLLSYHRFFCLFLCISFLVETSYPQNIRRERFLFSGHAVPNEHLFSLPGGQSAVARVYGQFDFDHKPVGGEKNPSTKRSEVRNEKTQENTISDDEIIVAFEDALREMMEGDYVGYKILLTEVASRVRRKLGIETPNSAFSHFLINSSGERVGKIKEQIDSDYRLPSVRKALIGGIASEAKMTARWIREYLGISSQSGWDSWVSNLSTSDTKFSISGYLKDNPITPAEIKSWRAKHEEQSYKYEPKTALFVAPQFLSLSGQIELIILEGVASKNYQLLFEKEIKQRLKGNDATFSEQKWALYRGEHDFSVVREVKKLGSEVFNFRWPEAIDFMRTFPLPELDQLALERLFHDALNSIDQYQRIEDAIALRLLDSKDKLTEFNDDSLRQWIGLNDVDWKAWKDENQFVFETYFANNPIAGNVDYFLRKRRRELHGSDNESRRVESFTEKVETIYRIRKAYIHLILTKASAQISEKEAIAQAGISDADWAAFKSKYSFDFQSYFALYFPLKWEIREKSDVRPLHSSQSGEIVELERRAAILERAMKAILEGDFVGARVTVKVLAEEAEKHGLKINGPSLKSYIDAHDRDSRIKKLKDDLNSDRRLSSIRKILIRGIASETAITDKWVREQLGLPASSWTRWKSELSQKYNELFPDLVGKSASITIAEIENWRKDKKPENFVYTPKLAIFIAKQKISIRGQIQLMLLEAIAKQSVDALTSESIRAHLSDPLDGSLAESTMSSHFKSAGRFSVLPEINFLRSEMLRTPQGESNLIIEYIESFSLSTSDKIPARKLFRLALEKLDRRQQVRGVVINELLARDGNAARMSNPNLSVPLGLSGDNWATWRSGNQYNFETELSQNPITREEVISYAEDYQIPINEEVVWSRGESFQRKINIISRLRRALVAIVLNSAREYFSEADLIKGAGVSEAEWVRFKGDYAFSLEDYIYYQFPARWEIKKILSGKVDVTDSEIDEAIKNGSDKFLKGQKLFLIRRAALILMKKGQPITEEAIVRHWGWVPNSYHWWKRKFEFDLNSYLQENPITDEELNSFVDEHQLQPDASVAAEAPDVELIVKVAGDGGKNEGASKPPTPAQNDGSVDKPRRRDKDGGAGRSPKRKAAKPPARDRASGSERLAVPDDFQKEKWLNPENTWDRKEATIMHNESRVWTIRINGAPFIRGGVQKGKAFIELAGSELKILNTADDLFSALNLEQGVLYLEAQREDAISVRWGLSILPGRLNDRNEYPYGAKKLEDKLNVLPFMPVDVNNPKQLGDAIHQTLNNLFQMLESYFRDQEAERSKPVPAISMEEVKELKGEFWISESDLLEMKDDQFQEDIIKLLLVLPEISFRIYSHVGENDSNSRMQELRKLEEKLGSNRIKFFDKDFANTQHRSNVPIFHLSMKQPPDRYFQVKTGFGKQPYFYAYVGAETGLAFGALLEQWQEPVPGVAKTLFEMRSEIRSLTQGFLEDLVIARSA